MHHAIVEVNIVIGVVLGEVLVARVVPLVVDAVIGLALSLIAHVVVVVFVVVILHRIFLYGRYILYPPVGDSKLLLAVTEFPLQFCIKLMLRIIPRIIGPINVQQVSPIDQRWVLRRGENQMKNATKNLASSTKMRKSFATNFGNKPDPLDS